MAQRRCDFCGKPYEAKRANSRFCCTSHRAQNGKKTATLRAKSGPEPAKIAVLTPPEPDSGSFDLVEAAQTELEALGIVDSRLGTQILTLARQMSNPFDNGSATSALSKELDRLFDKAYALANVKGDQVDEIQERRERKRREAAG